MKKKLVICICIFLSIILYSCDFISALFSENKKEEDIGEFEIEKIFEGDEKTLLDNNLFVTKQTIYNTADNIYMGTLGDSNEPAKIIKVEKKTKNAKVITLATELEKHGFYDNTAFCIHSFIVDGSNLIIRADRDLLMMSDQKFEIVCLDKDDLSVKWRFVPEENGNIDIYGSTDNLVKVWANYVIVIYKVENEQVEETDYFTLVMLDMNGKSVIKRVFNNYLPIEDELCIWNDRLYLHQKLEPIAVYDLTKVIDEKYGNEECIECLLSIGESRPLTSNISDGKNCYTHYWDENSESHICAMNMETKKIEWDYKFRKDENKIPNAMRIKDDKLIVPADYGTVYCFDTKTGKKHWETKLSDTDRILNLKGAGCFWGDYFVLPSYSGASVFFLNMKNGNLDGKKRMSINNTYNQCFTEDGYLYLTNNYSLLKIKFIPE